MKTSSKVILKKVLNDKFYNLLKFYNDFEFEEIRLRLFCPLTIVKGNKNLILNKEVICTDSDIKKIVINCCDNSFRTYESYIKQGYIPISGGRVGVAGIFNNGDVFNGITSLNIRIAKDIHNIAKPIINYIGNAPANILICGPPASGKTSYLRDITREFSNMQYRVSVADEKGEITGADLSATFDLGINCDYIVGIEKSVAINRLLRMMNPQIIVFDEIGSVKEAEAIYESLNSGIKIVTSIHSENINQLTKKVNLYFKRENPFEFYVILNNKFEISEIVIL